MFNFKFKLKKNELDTEIDEFGDLKSLGVKNDKIAFSFNKKLSQRAIERKKYNRTGISQLGTTYPQTYDREEFIKLSKIPSNLYRYKWMPILLMIFVILIDFCCYLSMFYNTDISKNTGYEIFLISVGVAVAIDLLPVFLAQNLHRQEVDRKKVLMIFNILCIVLAIIFICTIYIYRINNSSDNGEWNSTLKDSSMSEAIESFIYALIPIATSLFSFIVGYLTYNPIASKIFNKRKEVLFKQEDVNELKAVIEEMKSDTDYYKFLTDKDDAMYEAACNMIDSIGYYYKSYVKTEIMKKLHSPADTTDLSK